MFKKTLIKKSNDILSYNIAGVKRMGDEVFAMMYSNHKRHTIYKKAEELDYAANLGRASAFDYINSFVTKVIPKIESFVEKRLLEKFKMNLNPKEQVLVDDAYRMRKHLGLKNVIPRPEEARKSEEAHTYFNYELIKDMFSSVNGSGLINHSYDDIAKYTYFPNKLKDELFPFGCYGDYMKLEFEKTKLFSIMCREEGLKLANTFANIQTHEERLEKIDFEAILNKKFNFKEEIKNFNTFSLFYQEIAYSLLKVLDSFNNYEYNYLFLNAGIFDGLVTVLTRSLIKNPFNIFMCVPASRYKIIEQIVKEIYSKFANNLKHKSLDIVQNELKVTEKEFYPLSEFNDIIAQFKIFKFELDYQDVFNFADELKINLNKDLFKIPKSNFTLFLTTYYDGANEWRPEEYKQVMPGFKGFNSGVLLSGEGNGKSMILAYLHAWAKESNWFVFPVERITKYTQDAYPIERHYSGIYVQPELAQHFLRDFKIINYKLLSEFQVDLTQYGKCDFAGNIDGEPEAVPILWDEGRQVFTDSWKVWNPESEEEILIKDFPDHYKRIRDVLPKPKTLLEIADKGLNDQRFSNCAVAEILNALMKSEKYKTMVLIDEYNELFKPTIYDSYKYANYKNYDTKIPPHDLAMCRMFMKFNGHSFKQGVKVMAISLKQYDRHIFKPESIHFPKGYVVNVDNLKLNDLRNAMNYYNTTKLAPDVYGEEEINHMYALTGGNWRQLHLDYRNLFRMQPRRTQHEQYKRNKKMYQARGRL